MKLPRRHIIYNETRAAVTEENKRKIIGNILFLNNFTRLLRY